VQEGGTAYVIEVWESQEAQAEFMQSRLGAAMSAGGVTAAPKVTWARLVGHQNPGL
jgi:quinol monooxygenase YgiN